MYYITFTKLTDIISHIHNTFGLPIGLLEVRSIYYDPEILNRKYVGSIKTEEKRSPADSWHSDVTYENHPPEFTILKLDTLPPNGDDTL